MRAAPPAVSLTVDEMENCEERYAGSMLGIGSQRLMDGAHFLSAGVVSFARGLNDTPKIAAMLLTIKAMEVRWGMLVVAVAITKYADAPTVAIVFMEKCRSSTRYEGSHVSRKYQK